ncbi:TadE/TadG family type IV pilus assembly protein [Streptomyces sp. NPDC087270]|uniref:TadE/TadG family type IV pilus assembly protein n=1 Tax=Streptomyces sp. NPDC087270 TaxID=3365774 RepID=UPI00381DCB57
MRAATKAKAPTNAVEAAAGEALGNVVDDVMDDVVAFPKRTAPARRTAPGGRTAGDGSQPAGRTLTARLRALRGDDRGSGAAAVVIFALVFMALAAFVVDGGLSIAKRERAADIAEQAARYAAQDIDVEALRNAGSGAQPVIDYQQCTARVQQFARDVNLPASDWRRAGCPTPPTGPDRVEVVVYVTYKPILSGFFYKNSITVEGKADAVSITGPGN